jgi:hypothetical protein
MTMVYVVQQINLLQCYQARLGLLKIHKVPKSSGLKLEYTS